METENVRLGRTEQNQLPGLGRAVGRGMRQEWSVGTKVLRYLVGINLSAALSSRGKY